MASSASILLSKRMKPTPREPPAGPADHKQTGAPFTLQVLERIFTVYIFIFCFPCTMAAKTGLPRGKTWQEAPFTLLLAVKELI